MIPEEKSNLAFAKKWPAATFLLSFLCYNHIMYAGARRKARLKSPSGF